MVDPEFVHLIQGVIDGSNKASAAVNKIEEIVTQSVGSLSILLDCLVILEQDISSDFKDGKARFLEFCNLVKERIIPQDYAKLHLDVIADLNLSSKLVKTKTRLFYKQLKFNLLREESEGYSKLIVELNQPMDDRHFSHVVCLTRIRSLIGQFNLDPNRVMDIILESFECHPEQYAFYVDLLREYMPAKDYIVHIMGFKLTFFHPVKGSKRNGICAPHSLYLLAALLLRHGFIDWNSIYQYMTPSLDYIMNHHTRMTANAEVLEKSALVTPATVDRDFMAEFDSAEDDKLEHNQKMCFLQSLLEVGDWFHSKEQWSRLPEYYANRYPEIVKPLCLLIHDAINPFYYQSRSGKAFTIGKVKPNVRPPWHHSLEPVTSWTELVINVFPMLQYLGPYVYQDSGLMIKLIRLCKDFVEEPSTEHNGPHYCAFVDMCDEVLVPALSLGSPNPAMCEELWLYLCHLPYHARYRMYGHWKIMYMKRHPPMQISRARIQSKTRYIMKRLAKETVKQTGRQLAKLCQTHPTVVFDYLLNQIQQFENLIGPVVESLKFMTNLGFDVLAFCMIDELCSPGKERLKISGISISAWLQSMANFGGAVFKKYNIELTGVLQYVANQLKAGKSFDLLVLRDIILNMSGIETTSTLTSDQLEALSGGDLLRQEGGYLAQVRNTRRSINRLKDALLQEDLVVGLCLLMAQQRGSIVYKEGTTLPLKLVGTMLDQCQETLVQFGSFLSTNLRPEDYINRMPSAHNLIDQYLVSHEAAWFLCRPSYASVVRMRYEDLKRVDKAAKTITDEKKTAFYLQALEETISKLCLEILPVLSNSVWTEISPRFYVTFWTLTMYDIYVPIGSYEREIDKLQANLRKIEEMRDVSETKRKKERERTAQFEYKLKEEMRRQREHVDRVLARFRDDSHIWFPPNNLARGPAVTNFIQHCLFPRCLFTDLDALYCAKFIKILHWLQTPNFNTLLCFDRLFGDMMPTIMSLSENEAHCFGRFLASIMDTLMLWHRDEEVFKKECADTPGFATRVRNAEASEMEQDWVNYANYLQVMYKWHYRLTKALMACLTSGQYVPIRNSLLILIKCLAHYPMVTKMSEAIEAKVVVVKDAEKDRRQDLYALAMSYWGQLKTRRAVLYNPQEFRGLRDETRLTASSAVSSAKTASNQKQPERAFKRPDALSSTVSKSSSTVSSSAGEAPAVKKLRLAPADGRSGTPASGRSGLADVPSGSGVKANESSSSGAGAAKTKSSSSKQSTVNKPPMLGSTVQIVDITNTDESRSGTASPVKPAAGVYPQSQAGPSSSRSALAALERKQLVAAADLHSAIVNSTRSTNSDGSSKDGEANAANSSSAVAVTKHRIIAADESPGGYGTSSADGQLNGSLTVSKSLLADLAAKDGTTIVIRRKSKDQPVAQGTSVVNDHHVGASNELKSGSSSRRVVVSLAHTTHENAQLSGSGRSSDTPTNQLGVDVTQQGMGTPPGVVKHPSSRSGKPPESLADNADVGGSSHEIKRETHGSTTIVVKRTVKSISAGNLPGTSQPSSNSGDNNPTQSAGDERTLLRVKRSSRKIDPNEHAHAAEDTNDLAEASSSRHNRQSGGSEYTSSDKDHDIILAEAQMELRRVEQAIASTNSDRSGRESSSSHRHRRSAPSPTASVASSGPETSGKLVVVDSVSANGVEDERGHETSKRRRTDDPKAHGDVSMHHHSPTSSGTRDRSKERSRSRGGSLEHRIDHSPHSDKKSRASRDDKYAHACDLVDSHKEKKRKSATTSSERGHSHSKEPKEEKKHREKRK